jgi:hypothetical protein
VGLGFKVVSVTFRMWAPASGTRQLVRGGDHSRLGISMN